VVVAMVAAGGRGEDDCKFSDGKFSDEVAEIALVSGGLAVVLPPES